MRLMSDRTYSRLDIRRFKTMSSIVRLPSKQNFEGEVEKRRESTCIGIQFAFSAQQRQLLNLVKLRISWNDSE